MNKLILLFVFLISLNFTYSQDYCDVLKKTLIFYKAQRSGRLPDSDVPWRANSALNDSYGSRDLSGGYFDAGDHVKFALPMAYTITMLSWSYIQYESNIASCGLTGLFQSTIKYGSDWLIAAHISPNEFVAQVGNGGLDHSFWGPPELMKMERPVYLISSTQPGTEVAMEAAAALAATSIVFSKSNPSYSMNCLSHAEQLHNFGYIFRGVYSDSVTDAKNYYNSWSGYKDELVWGSAWLFKATNDQSYLNKAKSDYASFGVGGMGQGNSQDWDLKAPGASLLLYQLTKDPQYQRDIESHLKYWLPGGGVTYTPGGLPWIRQWGPNRYAATEAFLASMYGGSQFTQFTKKTIEYLLGNNPLKISYVIGVGSKFPKNPHHRASHYSLTNNIANPIYNTYELTGALVGGPGQGDDYVDDRTDYIKNEVACDYNSGLVGAIASLIPVNTNPTTQPPITSTLTTQPPVTSNPTTQPPITSTPTTQPPVTSTPTTQPPITSTPSTQPSTPKPTIQPPTTTKPLLASSSFFIYQNGQLNSKLFDYSWGNQYEHSLRDISHLYNGSPSIAFQPNNYNALYLGCQGCISTNKNTGIEFYIHGGDSTGSQVLTLGVLKNSGTVFKDLQSILGSPIQSNQWNKISVKFSDLGISSNENLNGLWIQATKEGYQPMVYFANIRTI